MTLFRAVSRGALGALLALSTAPAQDIDSTILNSFRWRSVGPANFGGRVSDIAGIPSPSKTFYVAAAGGGIWKTTNAGITFKPIFDNQRVVAMGMLAIAPSDTNQVWAGTGEPNSRNTIEPGGGIYKSTDGGKTWKLVGLEKTQHIGRIVVHPTNPNIVYVAALGAAWKANPQRGLYKTSDGGATWMLAKFIDDSTGFVDVAMDPSNPEVLYASSYQLLRGPYFVKSGGKGSGLWKSTDGGTTWTQITGGGFPETNKGRIGIAISRSQPNIVYTLVEADSNPNPNPTKGAKPQKQKSGLYRSGDSGKTWTFMNDHDSRPFYYSQVRVDPKDPNRVYWSSTPVLYSDDGGTTARTAAGGVHVDHHAMWIDPNDSEHIIIGDDGGVSQSWDRGGNFEFLNTLPIGQFYAVSYDFSVPYNICGGAQDNGTWCGPSRRKGNVPLSYWFQVDDGDGFWTAMDPLDPKTVYGEEQNGLISRTNLATGALTFLQQPGYAPRYKQWEDSLVLARGDTTIPETKGLKARIADLRSKQRRDSIAFSMRFNWETPFFLSPHNPQVLYMGGNLVLKSTQRGDNLYPISPDLSKQLRGKIDTSTSKTGGITLDASGAYTYGSIVALAESYVKPGILYAGTDDGNVWCTIHDGAQWAQVPQTKFAGLPNMAYVSRVEPSHFDTLTWYVSFDNHRTNDFTPYLYTTIDGGKTFTSLAATLPTGGPDYVRVIREDPVNRDLLFAGTSVAVYVSTNRGKSWQKFNSGMPTVPVFDLQIQPRDHDLIAATHGRGFFIVNIAALEQMASKTLAGPTLFEPTHAYEWGEPPIVGTGYPGSDAQRIFVANSPQYGADIYYSIPTGSPATPVQIYIQDASGDTLQTLSGAGAPGLQHVTWGFRGQKVNRALPPMSPSEFRDSVRYYTRTAYVLDSVAKAGWDTTLVRRGREMLITTIVVNVSFDCGGGAGTNPDRRAEGGIVSRSGCILDIGGSKVACDKWKEVLRAASPSISVQPAQCSSSLESTRSTNTFFEAQPGDYLVSMVVGGKTYRQTLRVDRAAAGEVKP
jgi:photosystem II stability/assembly factor-like uncharacterized protein